MKTKMPAARRLIPAALLTLASSLGSAINPAAAQSAQSAAVPPEPSQIVQMSAFEVRTTLGQGYAATNAAAALKSNQALLDTPQDVLIVTNDLVTDVNYENSTGVLKYAGVVPFYQGESIELRGSRDNNPYIDGLPDNAPYADDVNVDTYEVIKGPVAVLYPQAALSGIVIKVTKKPLPFRRDVVTAALNQWGDYRATLDSTGPLGTIGEAKIGFRIVAAYEGGNQYFQNLKNDRVAIHPSFEAIYKHTDFMIAYDYQTIFSSYGAQGVLTPDGQVYTGWGRRGDGLPSGNNEHHEHVGLRAILKQQISENWAMNLQVSTSVNTYGGQVVSPYAVDWGARTESFEAVREKVYGDIWALGDDFIGKYYFGWLKNQSTFGFTTINTTSRPYTWATSNNTFQTVPLTVAGINSVVIPPASQFPVPPNPGTRSVTQVANIYFQQQMDVIPNWLTLVGGFTFSDIETVQDTNIAVAAPYASTDSAAHQYLHRFGPVAHLTKEISLYGLESTSYSGGSGVDYFNRALPNVQGKSDEVGFKTALFGGKISLSAAAFNMALTNQKVVVSGLNVVGQIYSENIGSTRTRGWDGSMVLALLPGWELIGTAYRGTVRTQANLPLSLTYLNSWSVFTRYDLGKGGTLKGLSIGGGASRVGSYFLTSSGETLPGGATPAPLIKLREGTGVDAFIDYAVTKHFDLRLNAVNLLDKIYPTGVETIAYVDPSLPRTFALTATYSF